MATPYNRNAHNYWFLLSLSNLSIAGNLIPIHPLINGALLSANVFALIWFSLITAVSPMTFYNSYAETFKHILRAVGLDRALTPATMGLVGWLYHAIPVWVFSRRYTPTHPEWWFVVYLLVFGPVIHNIYPMSNVKLFGLGLVSYVLMYACGALIQLYWHKPLK